MGNKLKNLIQSKGFSQWDFAKRVGVSQPTISYLINEERAPSVRLLKKMAKVLNVTMDELV